MSTTTAEPRATTTVGRLPVAACAAGALLAAAPIVVLGPGLMTSSGAGAVEMLAADAWRYQLGMGLAALATPLLMYAAARLGERVGGVAGRLAVISGAVVAALLSLFYAVFAGASVVAGHILDEPSGGLGEATFLLVNAVDLARFGPGLALAIAVILARRALPRPLGWSAWFLVALTLFPMTGWVAAMVVPVWLGIAGAVAGPRAHEA